MNLLRIYREAVELDERCFQRREKHIEMNATSKLLKHRSDQHIKLSKTSLNKKMQRIHDPKHTRTLNKSNQFYISKTKSRQFNEHTLTHVNLVMAKSHCTCTCIKSSKEFCMLYVKSIARLQMCQHVMTI